MCLEDIMIARALRTRIWETPSQRKIGANNMRWSLRISCDQGELGILQQLAPADPVSWPSGGLAAVAFCDRTNLPAGSNVATLPDMINLWNYGDKLWEEFVLVSLNGLQVYCVETWLDISTLPIDIVGKLGYKTDGAK